MDTKNAPTADELLGMTHEQMVEVFSQAKAAPLNSPLAEWYRRLQERVLSCDSNVEAVAAAHSELQKGLRLFRAFESADKALRILLNVEQLIAERHFVAERVIEDAQGQADAILEPAQAQVKSLSHERDQLKTRVSELQQRAADLEAAHAVALAEHEGLRAQVAEARATIARAERLQAAMADSVTAA